MKIKICGIRRLEDVLIINEYKPDLIGFIFYPFSKRFINLDEAMVLSNLLDNTILKTGVFVNEEINEVIKYSNKLNLDYIQLHGKEDNKYINELKSKVKSKIIKVIRVNNSIDNINYNSDLLLFDSFTNNYGGEGIRFDLNILDNKNINKDYFIAGGINNFNIYEILKLNPYGVDISSGVEVNGYKDKNKIKNIIKIIREYKYE